MIEFIVETRGQFRDYVSQDAGDARLLKEEIGRLKEDTERLASIIDEKFKVVRERSKEELGKLREKEKEYPQLAPVLDVSRQEETNVVRETRRLQHLLDQARKDGSGDDFRDVFDSDIEIEDLYWRLTYEQSSSAYRVSRRPQQDGHELLSPLAEPGVKSCVSLSSAGYETGLDYFPADTTIAQARIFFKHYAEDLRRTADRYGNTHALLYFRFCMAEMVYHEYQQFGSVREWTQEEVEDEWIARDFSSSNLENPIRLMSAMEDLLANPPDDGKEVWRKEEGNWVPNAAGLHSHLRKQNLDLLRRESDTRSSTHISPQTLRKYVKSFKETELVKLRSEAHLDPK